MNQKASAKQGFTGLFHNERGVELSLNTVVIAILVLVVLAVLITIFSTQMQNALKQIIGLGNTTFTDQGRSECEEQGHNCAISCLEESSEMNLRCSFGKKCCS